MTVAEGWTIAAAALLVPLAALAGAAETAFGKLTVARALRMVDEDVKGARRVLALTEDGPRTLSTLALVRVLCQVTASALVVGVLVRRTGVAAGVALGAVASALVLYVLSEVAPKTYGYQQPEVVARRSSGLVRLLSRLLRPFVLVLIRLGNVVAPGRGLKQGPYVTEDAIRDLIDEAESGEVIEESEREMIHSIFELGETLVREIMVPRPDVVMVPGDASLSDVIGVVIARGYSRLPVHDPDDRDEIVGVVYAKDALRRLHEQGSEAPWEDLRRPAFVVPELKRVDGLLRELQQRKVHLAVVVDEYGAVVGIVTIEDILEEIVGEIVDEYDREEVLVEPLGDDRWRVDARLPVDELDDLVDTALPAEEWDTVGGLLFGMLGHVPRPGEGVEVDGVRLVAERVHGRRIAKVLVERREPAAAAEAT